GLLLFMPASQSCASDQLKALKAFGNIPVLEEGRYKPWDSLARNSLLMIYEKQSFRTDDGKLPAIAWLSELVFSPEAADERYVFRVMHPDVRVLLGDREGEQKYFSFDSIRGSIQELTKQVQAAEKIEAQLRSPYQRAIVKLMRNLNLYQGIKRSILPPDTYSLQEELKVFGEWSSGGVKAFKKHQKEENFQDDSFQRFLRIAAKYQGLGKVSLVRPVPTKDPNQDWFTIWDGLVRSAMISQHPAIIEYYAKLAEYYRSENWEDFSETATALNSAVEKKSPEITSKSSLEAAFNRSEVFYRSSVLYVFAFLLVLVSWLKWEIPLNRLAYWIIVVALIAHTAGLILRMVIQGRPPVTNLYSSALFVGWGGVVIGVVLERLFKNGLGSACAASLGFLTLIVAHNLAGDGDTMAMLQAVLDTNFWLATHVVIITLGYSATFLAGFLAAIFILRGFFTGTLDRKTAEALERMVFGIVCFALLFSFVGTVLGGIWADQSWGRFWGWDPKENGALLIVLWNAIILHARWGKLVKRQGTMVLAVFGNIVTAWSWFGTNMLGIGLHSYGFMDQAFFWLMAFVFSQVMLMLIGMIPAKLWDSLQRQEIESKY
ncbi:MAG: cytochrome c biogenesis protein CcsA, partial [Verrucomicrobiota bacterium]